MINEITPSTWQNIKLRLGLLPPSILVQYPGEVGFRARKQYCFEPADNSHLHGKGMCPCCLKDGCLDLIADGVGLSNYGCDNCKVRIVA